MHDRRNGPGSSANWTVNKQDLADSVLTDQQFGTDRFAVAKEAPNPAVVLDQQRRKEEQQEDRSRDSDYWATGTKTAAQQLPCPPQAVAAAGEKKQTPGFLQRCAHKVKGIVYDLQHFSEVQTPDNDNSFVGKIRYIATRDDRCGVSVGLVVLVVVILLSVVGLVVAMGMKGANEKALQQAMGSVSNLGGGGGGVGRLQPRLPSTTVNYFNPGKLMEGN